ncbi:MAG TPA: flagellar biosynthesis protein FlhF [Clostridiaceae bacterium]|nr:flagellar biosynthesis protein FlhF [Clostridiaceae bacterium]
MIIRRYLGSNAQEAILKVKMDLGNDALILHTRKVRQKGLFKIFSKPLVEVLAAVDDNSASNKELKKNAYSENGQSTRQNESKIPYSNEKDEKIEYLESKISGIEDMLKKLYDQVQRDGNKSETYTKNESENISGKVLQLFYNNLIKNEVEEELAKKIIDTVRSKLGDNANVNVTVSHLQNLIKEMLGEPETLKLKENGKSTVVMFVGPTGVGKTTTLAKIAANYVLNYKKSVALITADTYRIAAVEQLKTYAEILGIPISVIYSPDELSEVINSYSDKDVILIDTAGRSHRNTSQFDELKALVSQSNADEIYLVLSTTTNTKVCKDIISKYSFLKDYKLIFTKIDEAPVSGIILNIRHMTGKRLSYITNGQNVPDDIEIANIDKIIKSLIGSIYQ